MARLVAWFKYSLKKRPVLTNTAVYAAFYTAAEMSQQSYNKIYSSDKFDLDIPAAARIIAVGSTLYAPTLFYWYKFLDKHFTGTAMKTVLTKVCLDQFTMTPVLMATFFTLLGILEGNDDIFEELKHKYWKAFFANQIFWIPGQIINFYFVPSNLRVVYVASASFIWINVMVFIKREKLVKIETIDVNEFSRHESEEGKKTENQKIESKSKNSGSIVEQSEFPKEKSEFTIDISKSTSEKSESTIKMSEPAIKMSESISEKSEPTSKVSEPTIKKLSETTSEKSDSAFSLK